MGWTHFFDMHSGGGMKVTSRPCTPEEIEELVALKKKLQGEES